jgi:hypothetical protein
VNLRLSSRSSRRSSPRIIRRSSAQTALAAALARCAPALALLLLAGCGGGGGGSGASAPGGVALSADQQIYEDAELHGGTYALLWNLPYGGGALVNGVDYFSAAGTGGLVQSPAIAGPQRETPVITSLSNALTVPYQLPLRYLLGGQVIVRSAGAVRQVSYAGGAVQIDYLADDGQTIVESALFSDFSQVSLSGPMSNAPEELQAAYPVVDWINANHFSASTSWLAGSTYNKRHGAVVGDTYFAEDCTNSPSNPVTTTANIAACQTGATLDGFFPVTLVDPDGHPYETDFAGDGSIQQVQGLRMWIANAPLADELDPTTAYRVYYELDGNVYMGTLWKDATAFCYLQTDGSAVDYLIGLNQAAADSVQSGLVTSTVNLGSPAGTAAEVPTLDLFGIGGHGVNGALSPADLAEQYGVPAGLDGTGQTIAIVDAPGSGAVADDLNVFSRFFGLPQCNGANPCLQQIDLSNGAPVSPTADWGAEVAMDTQMVHAMAPGATIVLVTANSPSTADLLNAANYAAALPGVTAVSMSFSIYNEPSATYQSEDQLLASYQAGQGMIFFAASGDSGNSWQGAGYPAESPNVTAVGGTRIYAVSGAASPTAETAWQFSSGGPSSYASMPAWQAAYLGSSLSSANAGMRATPDVAAVADYLHSAVAVYYKQQWLMAGGTSVSTPLWAGTSALLAQHLANKGASLPALVRATPGGFNGLLYQTRLTQGGNVALRDIVSGTNNLTLNACSLCSAATGYDDVTGLGVPNLAGFVASF